MKIQILISNSSWANEIYKKQIILKLKKYSKKIFFLDNHRKLKKNFDVNIIFSYFKLIPNKYLDRSKYNIITHEADLPKGRGMSPISWEILKNKKKITFCLLEAEERIDSGKIYYKKRIKIKNDTVFPEIKYIQFTQNIYLIEKFLNHLKKRGKAPMRKVQKGVKSFYRKRTPKDSELNIEKSIKQQFNLLRIVDNENYPAFFKYKNRSYILKIYKK